MVHKDSPFTRILRTPESCKIGFGTVKMTGVRNECDQSKTETKARNESLQRRMAAKANREQM